MFTLDINNIAHRPGIFDQLKAAYTSAVGSYARVLQIIPSLGIGFAGKLKRVLIKSVNKDLEELVLKLYGLEKIISTDINHLKKFSAQDIDFIVSTANRLHNLFERNHFLYNENTRNLVNEIFDVSYRLKRQHKKNFQLSEKVDDAELIKYASAIQMSILSKY